MQEHTPSPATVIREGASDPDVCDKMYLLIYGYEYAPRSIEIEGGDSSVIMRVPVTGILAHSPVGWHLLETGLNPSFARDRSMFGKIYPFGDPELRGPGDPLMELLDICGVRFDEIVGAATSHLHIDHGGGIPHFYGGSRVSIQRDELEFGLNVAGEPEAYWRPDYDNDAISWNLLDGDAQIAPGIDAISTPGHTPGHMSYRVRLRDSGTWIFAADAIILTENIEKDTPIGFSYRLEDDPKRRQSHDRLVELAEQENARLVPGHCPVVWPTFDAPPLYYT